MRFDRMVSEEACLDFDLTIEEFDMWIEARQNRRAVVDAPKGDPDHPKTEVPFYETINQLLGEEPSPHASDDLDIETMDTEEISALERFERGELDSIDDAIRHLRMHAPAEE